MTMAMTTASRGRRMKIGGDHWLGRLPERRRPAAGLRRGRDRARPPGPAAPAGCRRRPRVSPSVRPLVTAASAGVDWPSLTRRFSPCCPCRRRRRSRLAGRPARRRAARPAPRSASTSCRITGHQLAVDQHARCGTDWSRIGTSPRRIMVSVLPVTELSTKSSVPGLVVQACRRAGACGSPASPRLGRRALLQLDHACGSDTGKTTYIGSWLTIDTRMPRAGADVVAGGDGGAADLAVDRRADLGVVEIDLRLLQLRLGAQDLRLQSAWALASAVSTVACWPAGVFSSAWARPSTICGVRKLRLELRDRRLLGLDVGLKRPLLQPVQQLTLLDLGAFGEQHLVEIGRDARHQVDPVGRLDAARYIRSTG